ncbi:helix-turn-helix transcriptional regulator [Ideonella paludis]|uniref:helix-turn-helix transcriptional regulator n=1 Tax=Ideonella paludis TaxID=1233411 RepID=UPI00362B62BA
MAPPPPPRSTGRLHTADEACALLGVRKATLYAYVSRGLLTALPDPDHPKQSRYLAYEIELMLRQRTERRRPPPEPQAALLDGWPLIDTQLTGIVDGRLVMRGHDLLQWSQHASLEDTAALLWQVPLEAAFSPPAPRVSAEWLSLAEQLRHSPAQHRAATLWSLAMPQLEGGHWLQGEALAKALGEHLRLGVACFWARRRPRPPAPASGTGLEGAQSPPRQTASSHGADVRQRDQPDVFVGTHVGLGARLVGGLRADGHELWLCALQRW